MYDFEELDFYDLLGVSRSASQEEIKRAYRREITKYHPDRYLQANAAEMEYARRRSQMLTEAYATLSDFASRNAYNLDRRSRERRISAPPRATPPPPPQNRDHQAELYDQARAHINAGRLLQAAATLRQLNQINPFYRDSAELLATTEERLRDRGSAPTGAPRALPTRLPALIAGGIALAVLIGGTIWWLSGRATTPTPVEAGHAATAEVPTVANPAPTAPAPSSAPVATTVPTQQPASATPEPTSEPTEAPAREPQITPAIIPTDPPPPPTPEGALLLRDDSFTNGWAASRRAAWSVGPSDGRYRISAEQQIGVIWSYRSVPSSDVSVAVDIEALEGEGGLMLRFRDEQNYLVFTVEPQTGSFRLEQLRGGESQVLASGVRADLRSSNGTGRLEARLRGDQVRVALNGQVLADIDAPGAPTSPRFGFAVVARENRAEVYFDNLEIRALP